MKKNGEIEESIRIAMELTKLSEDTEKGRERLKVMTEGGNNNMEQKTNGKAVKPKDDKKDKK